MLKNFSLKIDDLVFCLIKDRCSLQIFLNGYFPVQFQQNLFNWLIVDLLTDEGSLPVIRSDESETEHQSAVPPHSAHHFDASGATGTLQSA